MNTKERWLLRTLAAVQFTHIVDSMVLMPLGPQLMRLFSIEPRRLGWLVSSYTLTAGVSALAGASFIDRFPRKRLLTILYGGFLIGTLACGFAPSYGILFAARAWTGAFGGILGGMSLSLVGDFIPEGRRGAAVGIVMTGYALAAVAGVPLGLVAAGQLGWHAPFVAIVLVGVLVLIGIQRFVPSGAADGPPPEANRGFLTEVFRDPRQRTALALIFCLTFAHFLLIPFISTSLVFNAGFRESQLPFIYLCGGAATFFTSPMVGRLADRYGRARTFGLFILLSLFVTVAITHLGVRSMPAVLAVTTAFFITGNARLVVALAMVTSAPPPARRGGFLVVNSSLQSAGSGLGAYLASILIVRGADGRLAHFGEVGYLSVFAALCALAVAIHLARLRPAIEHPAPGA